MARYAFNYRNESKQMNIKWINLGIVISSDETTLKFAYIRNWSSQPKSHRARPCPVAPQESIHAPASTACPSRVSSSDPSPSYQSRSEVRTMTSPAMLRSSMCPTMPVHCALGMPYSWMDVDVEANCPSQLKTGPGRSDDVEGVSRPNG